MCTFWYRQRDNQHSATVGEHDLITFRATLVLGYLVLGTWYLVIGTWYMVHGNWYLILDFMNDMITFRATLVDTWACTLEFLLCRYFHSITIFLEHNCEDNVPRLKTQQKKFKTRTVSCIS